MPCDHTRSSRSPPRRPTQQTCRPPNLTAPPPDPAISTGAIVPNSAFFLGLGVERELDEFRSPACLRDRNFKRLHGWRAVGFRQRSGPTNVHMQDRFAFAPSFQGGYFQRIGASDWLWGAKLSYNYLEATRPTITPLSRNSVPSPRSRTLHLCLLAAQPLCAPLRQVSCRKSTWSHSLVTFSVKATSTPEAVRRFHRLALG